MIDVSKEAINYQTQLFELIGEFWGRATGIPPEEFSSIDGFSEAFRRQGQQFKHRIEDAFTFAETRLRAFYAQNGTKPFALAKRLGGTKLVLGGSSNFGTNQFASARSTLLYADTVLIADPLYPWLEDAREHERFRIIRPLQEAHAILHLRPLIDAKLPHCPIFVFPSFEKSLEREDVHTKKGIDQLVADTIAHFVDPSIGSIEEVVDFVRGQTNDFIRAVEQHALFVAPEGPIGEPVVEALKRHEESVKTWRGPEYIKMYEHSPIGAKVFIAIYERLSPQFHLFENAEELTAHPLLSIEQQAHYFKLVSQVHTSRLSRLGLLDDPTRRQLAALSSERLEWLSSVPISMLARLREDGEHEIFRKMLGTAMSNLHESALEDVDKVAAEICREIDSGIARYNRSIREINEKFYANTAQTMIGAVGGGLGLLVPALAPYLGPIVPLATLTKLGFDEATRRLERRRQSRSLMGVLSYTKDNL